MTLLLGLPIFFCLPPGGDVTLYDMAARTVLRGGVHYRDVFDTNPPGIVWAQALIRRTCGWSYEVLRAWDLLIVGGSVVLLARWIRRANGSGYSVAWFAAGVALVYPFASQNTHCQRDPWMLLPVLVALGMRLRRLEARLSEPNGGTCPPAPWWTGPFPEGCCWGAAAWIKPHVILPAAVVWWVSVVPLYRRSRLSRWGVARDFLGSFSGGSFVGALGAAWLVGTGTWPYFFSQFADWNPEYAERALSLLPSRLDVVLAFFPPWSLAHLLAVPLAVIGVREFLKWPHRPARLERWRVYSWAPTERAAAARALLGALYLVWLFQSWVFQREAEYIHIPDTFLMMAVVAGQRWALGFCGLVWVLAANVFVRTAGADPEIFQLIRELDNSPIPIKLPYHPLGRPDLFETWVQCWREGGTPQVRNRVQLMDGKPITSDWVELEQVAGYLRAVDPPVADRELLCWNLSTHPLYLKLGVEPALRYMHWETVFEFRSKADQVCREVARANPRFVVSDLGTFVGSKRLVHAPGLDGRADQLPYWFPRAQANRFPWNQPIVVRAGRYAVHRVTNPILARDVEPPPLDQQVLRPGINEWSGSMNQAIDPSQFAPAYLEVSGATALGLVDSPSSWAQLQRMTGSVPPPGGVDFSLFVAVVGLSAGREMGLSLGVQAGELAARVESSRQTAPGQRYQIVVLPREGVTTVNGRPFRANPEAK
ncbi:hypothetical protein [Frigoriglobus tundricola]|uniref:hypothetical protein n=1 Tax=Frigoriglobus tundricola TaxID=2774151 RepID=UPI00148E9274|nr:hypothetical protein [Frigoriglobus tundricola]